MKSVLIILGHFVKTSQMVQPHVSAGMDTRNKMANVLVNPNTLDLKASNLNIDKLSSSAAASSSSSSSSSFLTITWNKISVKNKQHDMKILLKSYHVSGQKISSRLKLRLKSPNQLVQYNKQRKVLINGFLLNAHIFRFYSQCLERYAFWATLAGPDRVNIPIEAEFLELLLKI